LPEKKPRRRRCIGPRGSPGGIQERKKIQEAIWRGVHGKKGKKVVDP